MGSLGAVWGSGVRPGGTPVGGGLVLGVARGRQGGRAGPHPAGAAALVRSWPTGRRRGEGRTSAQRLHAQISPSRSAWRLRQPPARRVEPQQAQHPGRPAPQRGRRRRRPRRLGADVFITNSIPHQPARLAPATRSSGDQVDLVHRQLTGLGATGPTPASSHGRAMASLTGQIVVERDEDAGRGHHAPGGGAQPRPTGAGRSDVGGLRHRRGAVPASVTSDGCYFDVANTEATLAMGWVGLPPALNPGPSTWRRPSRASRSAAPSTPSTRPPTASTCSWP